MTNTFFVLLDLCMMLGTLLLILSSLHKKEPTFLTLYFVVFCGILMLWQLADLLWYLLPAGPFALLFAQLRLLAWAFLPLPAFGMALGFQRPGRRFLRGAFALIAIIPAITLLCLLVPGLRLAMLGEFTPQFTEPFRSVQLKAGVWYYIQTAFGISLILAAAAVVLYSYQRLKENLLIPARLLLVGLGLLLAGFLSEIVAFDQLPLDTSLIGTFLAAALFCLASAAGKAENARIQRPEVFDVLDEAVFILDAGGRIVDANRAALQWLDLLELPYSHSRFDDLLSRAREAGKLRLRPGEGEAAGGKDLLLLNASFPFFYHMLEGDINGENGEAAGKFVTLSDVTHNRLLIERLRETAGVDGLTGLPNRYRYQELLRLLDTADALPLSIIIGDVNGLKEINDKYGHQAGDKLIETVGELLRACCPPDGFAARIGGDEFAMLLPRHDRVAAAAIINSIQGMALSVKDLPAKPSLALGSATKYEADENLNLLISRADKRMYSNKN